MDKFKLVSKFTPTGDQPKAINQLVEGLNDGLDSQVLLGVTGSGKTFTMANIIAKVNRPTLVLAHNKTLAAQLYSEFKEFFPENAVEYFVSFYDYYQPEAYIPQTDTYIEKDSSVNEEIEKLRHRAPRPGSAWVFPLPFHKAPMRFCASLAPWWCFPHSPACFKACWACCFPGGQRKTPLRFLCCMRCWKRAAAPPPSAKACKNRTRRCARHAVSGG